MLEIGHHTDDGTEGEYWFIFDDNTPGLNSIIEPFDTIEEAEKICEKLMRERGELS